MQDSILWIHIILQVITWGVIFPAGMVLGVGVPFRQSIENKSGNWRCF